MKVKKADVQIVARVYIVTFRETIVLTSRLTWRTPDQQDTRDICGSHLIYRGGRHVDETISYFELDEIPYSSLDDFFS